MRIGTLIRLWTVEGHVTVSPQVDFTGTVPVDDTGTRTVHCPACGSPDRLRLVVIAPLAAVWCQCRHAWSYPWLHHRTIVDLVEGRSIGPVEQFEVPDPDAGLPPELLVRYPGLDVLIDTIGSIVERTSRQPDGPTGRDTLSLRLPSRHDPAARVDLARAANAASSFYEDNHRDGRPDDIFLVPLSRRELTALDILTYHTTPALPTQEILYQFARDLRHRATALPSADPVDVRATLTRHSDAADTLMSMARWATPLLLTLLRAPAPAPADPVDGEDRDVTRSAPQAATGSAVEGTAPPEPETT